VPDDTVLMLDTCGEHISSNSKHGDGWLVHTPINNFADFVLGSVPILPITALGGQYRLCWCSGGSDNNGIAFFRCTEPENVAVDFGELRLTGVDSFEQDRTCVSGLTCSIQNISGQHLSAWDRIWVLDTCGTSDLVAGLDIPMA
jgi:hypothetical protein